MKKTVLMIVLFFACTAAYGQGAVSEDAVEAAFIYHFINFIEWDDDQSFYYVCVPDNGSLGAAIQASLNGKTIRGRKAVVVNRTDACHILVSDQPPQTDTMLTIGPLAKGAMLEFMVIDNKLRFAVNLERIKKSKLKISSQLLKLAILGKDS